MTELAPPLVHHMHSDEVSPDTSDSECSGTHKDVSVQPTLRDVGKRVLYYSSVDKKNKYGTLRFIGETEFSTGTWCGVELNNASGKNNGTYKGIRYFTCDPNCGVFVPISKVEMDFGRRSRPNSTPSSRSTSVDREIKSGGLSASQKGGFNTLSLQQQIVNRLAAPVHKRSKTSTQSSSNNRRQPLKAFATKGVSREEPRETKKLPPFKSGGMMKSRSTENISKEGGTTTAKMPSKKSSSERDLRGLGGKSKATKKDNKISRKMRINSCSDIHVPEPAPPKDPTPVIQCPQTSTPGTRDEHAPDGCSSPDDDSGSNTSQSDDPLVSKTPVIGETAFVETPTPNGTVTHSSTPAIGEAAVTGIKVNKKVDTSGLESAPVLLIKNELKNPSYNHATMAFPEAVAAPNKCYKNLSSGSATLAHPLTQNTATHHSEETDSVVTQLLDPKNSLEGVTVASVLAVLREQHRLNTSHKTQLECLRKEYSDRLEKTERQQKAALKELVERHQSEIMALNRAHVDELRRRR